MIFEVAVYIANGLHESLGIPLLDDEIAYIAMHVGGRLERSRRADQLLTATIVCPGYYELHELLRSSVDRSLGQAIEVVGVETRVDPDWASIQTDLVLTTIDPAAVARGRSGRADPAVPHRRRHRARPGGGRTHPAGPAPGAAARRARGLLRADRFRRGDWMPSPARKRSSGGSARRSSRAASSTTTTSSGRSSGSGSRRPRSPTRWRCRTRSG